MQEDTEQTEDKQEETKTEEKPEDLIRFDDFPSSPGPSSDGSGAPSPVASPGGQRLPPGAVAMPGMMPFGLPKIDPTKVKLKSTGSAANLQKSPERERE